MSGYDDPDFFSQQKWRLTKSSLHYYQQNEDYGNDNDDEDEDDYPSQIPHTITKSSSVRAPRRSSSPPASLRRSSSTHPRRRHSPPPSKKGSAFTRKCTSFAKEQKARFYIIKRCVSMLVRLRKHSDS